MAKVKVNLSSGNILEKNLATAFKGSVGTYFVLDSEKLGNMGLPVILVSKVIDNRAVKILDPNEWNAVKENLRQIIAGNQMNYANVPSELSADDDFYTQLTLPVASFDIIKNNYKPVEEAIAPAVESFVQPEAPVMESFIQPQAPTLSVEPQVEAPQPFVMPTPEPAPAEAPAPMSAVEPIPAAMTEEKKVIDYASEKEAFLKACENMFDALVSKFNN